MAAVARSCSPNAATMAARSPCILLPEHYPAANNCHGYAAMPAASTAPFMAASLPAAFAALPTTIATM